MKEMSAENVLQAYLSEIFAHKWTSIAILSDNGTEFKNTALNEACKQCGIKRLFSNLSHLQGNSRIKNMHNFLKKTFIKFLESSDLEWDELLQFVCYCYNIFSRCNITKPQFFLMFGHEPAESQLAHCNNCSRYYRDRKGKIILAELKKLWKQHAAYLKQTCSRQDDYTPSKHI